LEETDLRRNAWKPLVTGVGSVSLLVALAVSADAVPVDPGKARGGSLVEVGPTAEHGFPAWYRDSNGVRLEACTTLDDPLCSTLPDEVPNPDSPVSYPDNFPGEFFYQLAGAELAGNGVDMGIGMDLEGAWAAEEVNDGDQMVFGRIRIRDKDIADGRYRITHPYGVDEFDVTGGDGINYTQDIGTTPGAFGQALASRVGPFLQWDPAVSPAAPAGYVGDPGVLHKVIGSPYGTNFVRVERIAEDGTATTLAETDQFSIQGRKATNAGVNIDKATYSVGADGKGVVEVYASSDAGQALQVSNAGLGFIDTRLRGSKGKYYARVAVSEGTADGKSISVVNVSDKPAATKTAKLVDVVTVSKAVYDATAQTLTVSAASSDQDATPGTLKVLGTELTAGTATIQEVVAPPATVTVSSDKGGETTVPVTGTGETMNADKPEAAAFASPLDAAFNQKVTLTGTGSTGTIATYEWKQVPATKTADVVIGTDADGTPIIGPSTEEVPVTDANRVTLTGADASVATFNAPAVAGPIAFELVVTGPAGASQPVKVQVNVTEPSPDEPAPAAPTANAGADQTARRGVAVALDGSASKLADEFKWERVSGPSVTITGATTAKPTVTYPLMTLPALNANGSGNPSYATSSEPLVLKLTVTGQGGQTSTDEVKISPAAETLTIATAEFRAGREWRVSGTSSVLAGQRVAVVLGSQLTGRVLGFATVDAAGAFTFRGAGTVTPPVGTTTVSAVSALGGERLGTAFRNR
jgi:hypothetical protein